MSLRLAAACVRTLTAEAHRHPNLWMLDGDLADSYAGNEFAEHWPDRFLMAGIAEQNMVSMAAGMASCGTRPWVFSFAAFLAYRAADQIRVSVAQTGVPVTLVGSHAGGCGGRNGKTHQCIGDLAILGSMPSFEIWTPCDAADTAFATRTLLAGSTPGYLRAPREPCPPLAGQPAALRWLTEPCDTVLLTAGLSAHWGLEIHERLATRSMNVGVLHVGRYMPLPDELRDVLRECKRWFVLEDHYRHGGLADAVSRHVQRPPDGWFGWPADWAGGSGSAQALRHSVGLDADSIAGRLFAICRPADGR